jgi:hypothetical protein
MLDLRLRATENADGRLVLTTPFTQTALLGGLAAATVVGQFFLPGVSWVLVVFTVIFLAGALFHERWEFDVNEGRVCRTGGMIPFRTRTRVAPSEVTAVLLELFTVGRSTRPVPETELESVRVRREGPFGAKHYCRLALLLDEEASKRLGRSMVTVEAIKARGVDELHAAAARVAEVLQVRLEMRQ